MRPIRIGTGANEILTAVQGHDARHGLTKLPLESGSSRTFGLVSAPQTDAIRYIGPSGKWGLIRTTSATKSLNEIHIEEHIDPRIHDGIER